MYKKIHQIFISDNDSPIRSQLKTNVEKIRSLYPEYDYNLYNDRMIQEILKNNFNHKTFQAYMDLKPYAFKADLARMCLLYLYGGYYFDIGIDIINRINLDEHDIVMVLGNTDKYHYNSILIENNFCFVKNKKNKIIKSIIDYIVDNVYNLDYNTHPLDITGPLAIGKIIDTKNKNITFCTVKSHSEFFTDEELDDNIVRGRKIAYYRDKMFYYFKHSEFNADLSKMGASGTNNYQKM
jgi:mannosyltransferase OCH1-like enzyme